VSGRRKTPTLRVFPIFARRLWKSVVTLAVTGNTISCHGVWRCKMPIVELLRLLLTEVDGTYGG
jgi:hypothetical protein